MIRKFYSAKFSKKRKPFCFLLCHFTIYCLCFQFSASNFEMLQANNECYFAGPQTSTFNSEAHYFALRQRRRTESAIQADRNARQQLLKTKRKRTRQAILDQKRSAYTSSEDTVFEDDDLGLPSNNVYIDEVMDMADSECEFEIYIDESDLSDSEISFFGAETDTEREEDGYATADFYDSDSESDRDAEDLDVTVSIIT